MAYHMVIYYFKISFWRNIIYFYDILFKWVYLCIPLSFHKIPIVMPLLYQLWVS